MAICDPYEMNSVTTFAVFKQQHSTLMDMAEHLAIMSVIRHKNQQETQLLQRAARRTVTVKTVLNVAQIFVELHSVNPALGNDLQVIGNSMNT